jgi:hypothetical protein
MYNRLRHSLSAQIIGDISESLIIETLGLPSYLTSLGRIRIQLNDDFNQPPWLVVHDFHPIGLSSGLARAELRANAGV